MPAVIAARDQFRRQGWEVLLIERDVNLPDQGDLLIYKKDSTGFSYHFHFVDVKRARAWTKPDFQFGCMYLTTEHQLHWDWWYIVFSHDLAYNGVIDMNKVPSSSIQKDCTINPRGKEQISTGVPIQYVTFSRTIIAPFSRSSHEQKGHSRDPG